MDRQFFHYQPPAATLYADDPIITRLRQTPKPFRVLDVGVYQGSYLMAHDVQAMLGYHGFELRYYDELMGGKNEWRNVGSPNLHDLLAVRYLLLPDSQTVPGFHKVLGPGDDDARTGGASLRAGHGARRTCAWWPAPPSCPTTRPCRPSSTRASRYSRVVLLPDTASADTGRRCGASRSRPPRGPRSRDWAPGEMRMSARRAAGPSPLYLLVGENWYRDWHATVDGKARAGAPRAITR